VDATLQHKYLELSMTKERFTQEILSLSDTMYGVARTYLRSYADCADAVQESILKAWAGLPALRKQQYFRTWVIRILINECKNMLNKQKRTVSAAELPETAGFTESDNDLYETKMALTEKYRVPLVLYHCEGYSVSEIARILRLSRGTVTSRLARGREILKHVYLTREVCFDER
jgi:RNA polymerase sigma-70 factor (ECF subfamily)